MNHYDVIIVGGGAAGLFCALSIKGKKKVLILEKNNSAGVKLLMAGAGRCNITHSGEIEEFLNHYGDNSKFLKGALKEFSNYDLINFFRERGLDIITDKNGKIFPETEKARDVLEILLNECKKNRVEIHYNEAVNEVSKNGDFFYLKSKKGDYYTDSLVITTGGKSYPGSGSTGDGYLFAEKLGHTIEATKPALTPVYIKNYTFDDISGVSLDNIKISLYRNNKKIGEHNGDIGFTHIGLSGPGIIDFSRKIEDGDLLKLNFTGKTSEEFRESFISFAEQDGKSTLKKFLKTFAIPESLLKKILDEAKLDWIFQIANIGKKERTKLTELLCEYPFEVEMIGDFYVAMATKGGISLKEISPKKMESKIVPHLYFAGEVLDIDGDTGGYNIQAAFSTGYAAAKSICGE